MWWVGFMTSCFTQNKLRVIKDKTHCQAQDSIQCLYACMPPPACPCVHIIISILTYKIHEKVKKWILFEKNAEIWVFHNRESQTSFLWADLKRFRMKKFNLLWPLINSLDRFWHNKMANTTSHFKPCPLSSTSYFQGPLIVKLETSRMLLLPKNFKWFIIE